MNSFAILLQCLIFVIAFTKTLSFGEAYDYPIEERDALGQIIKHQILPDLATPKTTHTTTATTKTQTTEFHPWMNMSLTPQQAIDMFSDVEKLNRTIQTIKKATGKDNIDELVFKWIMELLEKVGEQVNNETHFAPTTREREFDVNDLHAVTHGQIDEYQMTNINEVLNRPINALRQQNRPQDRHYILNPYPGRNRDRPYLNPGRQNAYNQPHPSYNEPYYKPGYQQESPGYKKRGSFVTG